MKAVEIMEQRQAKEKKLQKSKRQVMDEEARNLASAQRISSNYLEWKRIQVMQDYAKNFGTLITGDEAKQIQKLVLYPYDARVAIDANTK